MSRRDFLHNSATVIGLAMATSPLLVCKGKRSHRPNIILIFCDDLGYGDLSCYGHPTIGTPNLDRLAQEGIRLTSFYAAAPSCTPSRAALLTGRYPIRVGLPHVLSPDSKNGIPSLEITLAEALKDEGYRTMAIGKWHLGHSKKEFMPTFNGFDAYYGLLYSNDMKPPWVKTDVPLQLYRDTEPIEHPVNQSTLTERYTEEAVKFIKSSKDSPFFIYLPHSMPHLPIYTSERFKGQSRAGLYGDVIETIDWGVGRIMETLKEEGLDENTIVVFTSDNGPWLYLPDRMLQEGNKPWHTGSPGLLRGAKGTTYEGGVREPCIIRWLREIPAGITSAEMATTMDLYTSLLKAAGAEVPSDRPVDGNDILPMLKGISSSPTKIFYYFRGKNLEAVREGKWKFRLSNHARKDVMPGQPPTPELYDLDIDPAERYNVADEHPRIVNMLKEKLFNFAKEVRTNR